MNLQHLCDAPHVTVYFDIDNEWLYLDWEGELTLPVIQHACLEIAQCFVKHPYPRVLNDNAQVTAVDYEVAGWLAQFFLPHLHLAGVERLAWVVAPTPRAAHMAQHTVTRLPHEIAIALFNDLEDAVHWLQQTALSPQAGGPVPAPVPNAQSRLGKVVEAFEREMQAEPDITTPGWSRPKFT